MALKFKKKTRHWTLNENIYKAFINLFLVSLVNPPFATFYNMKN